MTADQPQLRLSDAEREDALQVLSEHVRTGRLDLTEFEERSAQVSTAKRRLDLEELFHDLPEPKPAVLRPVYPLPPPVTPARDTIPRRQPTSWGPRRGLGPVPIAALAAVVILAAIATRGAVLVLALPVLACLFASSFAGRRGGRF